MIHKVGDEYVISSYGTWLPGAYDTERTAQYAFKFSDAELSELQSTVNERPVAERVITFEMLQAKRAARL